MEFTNGARYARVAHAAVATTAVLEDFTLERIDDVRLIVDEVFNALVTTGTSRVTFALVVGPSRLAVTAHGTGSRVVDDEFSVPPRVLGDAHRARMVAPDDERWRHVRGHDHGRSGLRNRTTGPAGRSAFDEAGTDRSVSPRQQSAHVDLADASPFGDLELREPLDVAHAQDGLEALRAPTGQRREGVAGVHRVITGIVPSRLLADGEAVAGLALQAQRTVVLVGVEGIDDLVHADMQVLGEVRHRRRAPFAAPSAPRSPGAPRCDAPAGCGARASSSRGRDHDAGTAADRDRPRKQRERRLP